MKALGVLPLVMLLSACVPASEPEVATRASLNEGSLPPMKTFAGSTPVAPIRSNNDLALDFVELAFRMESGTELPVLTRFETPITLRVTGSPTGTLRPDLRLLVSRLRREAGIDISLTDKPDANITIEAVSRAEIRRVLPQAACFVAPNVTSLAEYRSARRQPRTDWTRMTRRERLAIFLPNDASPQEARDCLHEELAQALGPLNDLYRLPDSVFNDDNIHAVLTGFDMLMLRATYAPELHNGMSRAEASQVIGPLLARLNPRGERSGYGIFPDTSRDWIDAMETALTSGSSPAARRQSVERAVMIARRFNWGGAREGFSYYALGRLQVGHDSAAALAAFNRADAIYSASALMQIHAAHIAVQKAAFTLSAGDAIGTIKLAEAAIPVAARHQNAALLATLMMFKAEALDLQGDSVAAEALRVDSLGWARYGFGSDANVRDRLAEIRGLRPF